MIRAASPWFLFLLLFVPVGVHYFLRKENDLRGSFRFSDSIRTVKKIKPSLRSVAAQKMIYLRGLSLVLVIIALARPQSAIEKTQVRTEGIDIVLAVDTSTSMRAMDFEINGKKVDRLAAVKKVVAEFIEKRPNDRIGMIAFAGLAYTVCPLTLDHNWLEKNLERVEIGMMDDGTAIGSAVSAALNRVKDTSSKEKIIILLTDGVNNAGRISPEAASEAAAALGVRIYTIGAGSKGYAPYPVRDMFGNTVMRNIQVEIDEDLLRRIADTSGGEYFRATDTGSLEKIYKKIDELEKTPIEETGYNIYKELFPFFLVPALMILLMEIVLSNTVLRRTP
ncbi:MAG: VWA domain-containing protein [Candidatus Omnitrophota bacterium]|nr:VWA domain-containing protein [Candidatus Omnitrophota bacterium]